jgi:hypothetical protein
VLVHDLESMLLRDPPQNRFSTASVITGHSARSSEMSALLPNADIKRGGSHVRLVPKADSCAAANSALKP